MLPVVVICNSYSQQILLFALRMRIWNIFEKPVDVVQVVRSLDSFVMLHQQFAGYAYTLPACNQDKDLYVSKNVLNHIKKTDKAIAYISDRYQEKISLSQLASLSNMSIRKFSEIFQQ